MAEIALFHYHEGDTVLHRYDARHKFPLLILLAAALFHVAPPGLLLLTLLVGAAIACSRLSPAVLAHELRGFAVLLAVMFVAQTLSPGLPITSRSLAASGMLVWRLVLAVLLGVLFTTTTPLPQIRAAAVWYLRPFPFIPGGRVATMIELTVALIPLLFDTERGISEAQSSRCIQNAHRPVRRMRALAVPLLLKTFAHADAMAQAMESRCYTDERTMPELRRSQFDWAISIAVGGAAVALLVWLRA